MLGRNLLVGGVEYVGEVVNGRLSEWGVDEKESSKKVEGCRLEDVLSSMVSFVCASPRYFARLWQLAEYKRISVGPKSAKVVLVAVNCVGLYSKSELRGG